MNSTTPSKKGRRFRKKTRETTRALPLRIGVRTGVGRPRYHHTPARHLTGGSGASGPPLVAVYTGHH
jgi:hypothetical protein